jgi:hypothetical protein
MRLKISYVFCLVESERRQYELRREHRIGPAAAAVILSSVRAVTGMLGNRTGARAKLQIRLDD